MAEILDVSNTKLTGKSRAQKAAEERAKEEQAKAAVSAKIQEIAPAQVLGSSRGRRPVTGRIVLVPCPLYPEYTDEEGTVHPQLQVGFRVDNQQQFMEIYSPDASTLSMREQIDHFAKTIALIAHKFVGWDFLHPQLDKPIPVPDPSDFTTYYPLVLDSFGLLELSAWIVGPAFTNACLFNLGSKIDIDDQTAKFNETVQMMHGTNEITVGGPGYDQALEASLPPNSESA